MPVTVCPLFYTSVSVTACLLILTICQLQFVPSSLTVCLLQLVSLLNLTICQLQCVPSSLPVCRLQLSPSTLPLCQFHLSLQTSHVQHRRYERQLPPGMRVNIKYIQSTEGTLYVKRERTFGSAEFSAEETAVPHYRENGERVKKNEVESTSKTEIRPVEFKTVG